jgi:UDP-N-acetylglucosamine--N-acetylmuramyl-(pentapeptide) pyrophosphoryl-undecaprenol N-acetylglucosamine transferase
MAGGTGGHIFPGLAVAEALRERAGACTGWARPAAWKAAWCRRAVSRWRLIDFGGVRGKGPLTLALLPLRLLRAFWQAFRWCGRVKPDVLVGLGGYITFPWGHDGRAGGKPLVLHEQNSVAGMANKVLAGIADRVFTAFPQRVQRAEWVGNPLRAEFLRQAGPAERFAGRSGPLAPAGGGWQPGRQGAQRHGAPGAGADAASTSARRWSTRAARSRSTPARQLRSRRRAGRAHSVHRRHRAAFADADLIVCRAGASTVTEIAAVGAAALFVPFPHAVDDHQTTNARFLVDAGAPGWCRSRTSRRQRWPSAAQVTARSAHGDGHQGQADGKDPGRGAVVAACEQLAKVKTA